MRWWEAAPSPIDRPALRSRLDFFLPMPSVQRAGGEFGLEALSLCEPASLKACTA
jgi:hypothetical protein